MPGLEGFGVAERIPRTPLNVGICQVDRELLPTHLDDDDQYYLLQFQI